MKFKPLSLYTLSSLCVVFIAGCETYPNIQGGDADLARQILAENCVVGQFRLGNSSRSIAVREGIVPKPATHPKLAYRTRLKFETITIYNVKDLRNGWVEVDASGHGSRENFYFNRDTAEFACSNEEWRSVFNDPENLRYERTPLISGRMDRLD